MSTADSIPTLAATYHKVGVLATGHLMVENTRVGGADVGLEATVQDTDLTPVEVEGLDVGVADTSTELGLLKSRANCTHRRLGGQTRHAWKKLVSAERRVLVRRTVNSDVDDVSASHRRGDHGGGRDTRGVVRVDVDREVGILLTDGTNQPS